MSRTIPRPSQSWHQEPDNPMDSDIQMLQQLRRSHEQMSRQINLMLATRNPMVAGPILRHRLITNFSAQSEGVSVEDIIAQLLKAAARTVAA